MGRAPTHPVEHALTYLPTESVRAMKCQRCASQDVRWFTPRSYADRAAVLLCMACRRLTIVPPRSRRVALHTEQQRAA